MAYIRKYPNRINWENTPSLNTAVSAENLNLMDYALYMIDAMLQEWDSSKANSADLNSISSDLANQAIRLQGVVNSLLVLSNTVQDVSTNLSEYKVTTNAELVRLNQVKPENLKDQNDVMIVNPQDGDSLIYDSTSKQWKNGTSDVGLFVKNGLLMCRYSS